MRSRIACFHSKDGKQNENSIISLFDRNQVGSRLLFVNGVVIILALIEIGNGADSLRVDSSVYERHRTKLIQPMNVKIA